MAAARKLSQKGEAVNGSCRMDVCLIDRLRKQGFNRLLAPPQRTHTHTIEGGTR